MKRLKQVSFCLTAVKFTPNIFQSLMGIPKYLNNLRNSFPLYGRRLSAEGGGKEENICNIREFIDSFISDAVDWCRGKVWYWRLPFLIWFAYILIKHLTNPMYNSIFGALNLGIHELGHLVFSFFGKFIGVSGGTILQCFAPLFGMINFYRQRDYFSIALCFGWLSTNLFDVARYASDARQMNLPLVSPFGSEDVIHDWNYLLSSMGLLQFDNAIAFIIKCIAVLSMLACFVFGAWLVWQMMMGNAGSGVIHKSNKGEV